MKTPASIAVGVNAIRRHEIVTVHGRGRGSVYIVNDIYMYCLFIQFIITNIHGNTFLFSKNLCNRNLYLQSYILYTMKYFTTMSNCLHAPNFNGGQIKSHSHII